MKAFTIDSSGDVKSFDLDSRKTLKFFLTLLYYFDRPDTLCSFLLIKDRFSRNIVKCHSLLSNHE